MFLPSRLDMVSTRFVDESLVTVAVKGCLDRWFHGLVQSGRATQIAATLLAQSLGQVACTALAMHCFPCRGQAEPFFCSLVSFYLCAHVIIRLARCFENFSNVILLESTICCPCGTYRACGKEES